MAEPITAIYVQEDDDWTVTVAGQDKTLTSRAPGIIAARDSVDQLVDQLGAAAKGATVVHLLNGSALEFTAAYMTARLTRPESAPLEVPAQGSGKPDTVPEQAKDEPAGKPKNKAARKAKLTADIGDALESAKPAQNLPAATGSVTVAKATVPSARS
ncbi:hypothetical protein [Amycolatopsis sp.]|uniref:hypothetical protein n=1 Tax=Amycolatopsis sp. TaxID=37632 RepID=UPI002C3764B2|nr:hypothetical protein [Amycolatopsis sp.]HVV13909.1 hypothetical protein [Amycolatopsis sp.]